MTDEERYELVMSTIRCERGDSTARVTDVLRVMADVTERAAQIQADIATLAALLPEDGQQFTEGCAVVLATLRNVAADAQTVADLVRANKHLPLAVFHLYSAAKYFAQILEGKEGGSNAHMTARRLHALNTALSAPYLA